MKPKNSPYRYSLPAFLVAISFILNACGAGTPFNSGDGTQIWLDQPVTGYLLPLSTFTLRAHASHPGGNISRVVFLVNTVAVGDASTDPSTEFINAQADWNPSAPGHYTIQAQAITPGGGAYSEIASVCVSAEVKTAVYGFNGDCSHPTAVVLPSLTPTATATTPLATGTPTITPTFTPTDTSAPTMIITKLVTVAPPVVQDTTPPSVTGTSVTPSDNVYYTTGCGANTVLVQATVTDPSGVKSVSVVYHYSIGSTNSIDMSGGGSYSATINVGSEAYGILAGANSTLTITIQATDKLGNKISVNVGSVSVQFCPG